LSDPALPPTIESATQGLHDPERHLETLQRLLRRRRGQFAFVLVDYDLPRTREWLLEQLQSSVSKPDGLMRVDLAPPDPTSGLNVLDVLREQTRGRDFDALFVTGLETFFSDALTNPEGPTAQEQVARALQPLNLGRSLLADEFTCPCLFCLPAPAMALFLRSAPDLNTWKIGTYQFRADRAVLDADIAQAIATETLPDGPDARRCEAMRIQALIKDAEAAAAPKLAIAGLNRRLGDLLIGLEDRVGAGRAYEAMAVAAEQAGDLELRRTAATALESLQGARRRPAFRSDSAVSAGSADAALRGLELLKVFKGTGCMEEGELFGRDRELDALETRLLAEATTFLLLWGETGSGKSSLVRGGLIPRLKGLGLPVGLCNRWQAPQRALIEAIRPDGAHDASVSLRDALIAASRAANGHPVVVVCDQFEQLFTQLPAKRDRHPVLQAIASCVNDPAVPAKFLFLVRHDRLSVMSEFEFPGGISDVLGQSRRLELPLFGPENARTTLHHLSAQAHLDWPADLIEEVVRDLNHDEHISPIELQIAATALALAGGRNLNDYAKAGRAYGLIADYIDYTVNLLAAEVVGKERRARRPSGEIGGDVTRIHRRTVERMKRVLLALVSDDEPYHRLSLTVKEVAERAQMTEGDIEALLESLQRGKLVHWHQNGLAELMHDRLVDLTLQATRGVQDERRRANRRLQQAVEIYKDDKSYRLEGRETASIRANADPARLGDKLAGELLRRSRLHSIVRRLSLTGLTASGLFAALVLVQFTTGYTNIERGTNGRIVVQQGLPGLRLLPGAFGNRVLLDTGYTQADLDQDPKRLAAVQEHLVWDWRVWRRHGDVLGASWFLQALHSPAKRGILECALGRIPDGLKDLRAALQESATSMRAVEGLLQVVRQEPKEFNSVVVDLTDATRVTDIPTQAAAIRALGELALLPGAPSFDHAPLYLALSNTDPGVRAAAAAVLARLNDVSPQVEINAVEAVKIDQTARLTASNSELLTATNPYDRLDIERRLRYSTNTLESDVRFANGDIQLPNGFTLLWQQAYEKQFDDRVALAETALIVFPTHPEWAAPLLLKRFRAPFADRQMADPVTKLLCHEYLNAPSQVIEPLLTALKARDNHTYDVFLDIIVQSFVKQAPAQAQRVVDPLIGLLKSGRPNAQSSAPTVLAAVVKAAPAQASSTVDALIDLIKSGNSNFDDANSKLVAVALASPEQASREVDALIDLIKSGDYKAQSSAFSALVSVAKAAPALSVGSASRAVHAMLDLLKRGDGNAGVYAPSVFAAVVKAVPAQASSIVDALIDLLKIRNIDFQGASRALAAVAKASPAQASREVDALIDLIKSGDYKAQSSAFFALAAVVKAAPALSVGSASRAVHAMLDLIKSDDRYARSYAPTVLAAVVKAVPAQASSTVAALLDLLKSKYYNIRSVASSALAAVVVVAPVLPLDQASRAVNALLDLLKSEKNDIRYFALSALAAVVKAAPALSVDQAFRAVHVLIDLSGDSKARSSVISILAAVVKAAPAQASSTVAALLDLLKSEKSDIRSVALSALAAVVVVAPALPVDQASRAVNALIDLIKSGDLNAQTSACYALAAVVVVAPALPVDQASRAVNALIDLIKSGDPNAQTSACFVACYALAAVVVVTPALPVDQASRVVNALIDLSKGGFDPDAARSALVDVVVVAPALPVDQASRAVNALIDLLKIGKGLFDANSALAAVALASPEQASREVDALIDLLKSEKSDIRYSASSALAAVVEAAPAQAYKAIDALIDLLKRGDDNARSSAPFALFAVVKVAPALPVDQASRAIDTLVEQLKNGDSNANQSSIELLIALIEPRPALVLRPTLLRLLNDRFLLGRITASALLQRTALDLKPGAFPIGMMSDRDPFVRVGALLAFDEIARVHKRTLWSRSAVYLNALQDRNGSVRDTAFSLLMRAAADSPEGADCVLPLLRRPATASRAAAILQRAMQQKPALFLPDLLLAASGAGDDDTRMFSLALLDDLATNQPARASAALTLIVQQAKDPAVRAMAAFVMVRVTHGNPQLAAGFAHPLLQACWSGNILVKAACSEALNQIVRYLPDPSDLVDRLIAEMKQPNLNPQIRLSLAATLLDVSKRETDRKRALPVVLKQLANPQSLVSVAPGKAEPPLLAYLHIGTALPVRFFTEADYRDDVCVAAGHALIDKNTVLYTHCVRLRDASGENPVLRYAAWVALGSR
jgi:hypothetical protein